MTFHRANYRKTVHDVIIDINCFPIMASMIMFCMLTPILCGTGYILYVPRLDESIARGSGWSMQCTTALL